MLYFLISFFSSVVGAICGIGGGVIIKPVLDAFELGTAAEISFLSGCTVLSMSAYSFIKGKAEKKSSVDAKTVTPLAIGAAVGGLIGKYLFGVLKSGYSNQNVVSLVQSICLAVITVGTFVYTLRKSKIKTLHLESGIISVFVGLILGIMSSFLGIGGGPINLVVLFYFFSMDTKTAAGNSLYIILFSQLASLISTLVTNSMPEFRWTVLCLMVGGGIGGGIIGRFVSSKMENEAVDKFFLCLMMVIIAICIYNCILYA